MKSKTKIQKKCSFYSQESEIVEVLWKQDVDLGYTLNPPVKSESAKSVKPNSTDFNSDDNEKLKALQDLKDGKVSLLPCHINFSIKIFYISVTKL